MATGYLFGAGAVLLFWVLSGVLTGRIAPWALAITDSKVKGEKQEDLSASKLQALVWTYVTLFVYASVFGARVLSSDPEAALGKLSDVPISLLVLMGLSVATAAGSKGVTVSYKDQGRIEEKSGGAFTNPDGNPNLAKAQMLIWTFVAAGIYVYNVVTFITGGDFKLPEVDGALLVLMGASQGAYVGDKLVSRDIRKTPKLNSLLPLKGPAGTTITILGENFGDAQGENFVSLDDSTIRSQADGLVDGKWSDSQLRVIVPTTYKAGDKIAVGVYRDGEWSNKLPFEVT